MRAVIDGDFGAVEAMVKTMVANRETVDVNVQNHEGKTILILLAESEKNDDKRWDILHQLLEEGLASMPNYQLTDVHGNNFLMAALASIHSSETSAYIFTYFAKHPDIFLDIFQTNGNGESLVTLFEQLTVDRWPYSDVQSIVTSEANVQPSSLFYLVDHASSGNFDQQLLPRTQSSLHANSGRLDDWHVRHVMNNLMRADEIDLTIFQSEAEESRSTLLKYAPLRLVFRYIDGKRPTDAFVQDQYGNTPIMRLVQRTDQKAVEVLASYMNGFFPTLMQMWRNTHGTWRTLEKIRMERGEIIDQIFRPEEKEFHKLMLVVSITNYQRKSIFDLANANPLFSPFFSNEFWAMVLRAVQEEGLLSIEGGGTVFQS